MGGEADKRDGRRDGEEEEEEKEEAVVSNLSQSKAYFRRGMAYSLRGDFDEAQVSEMHCNTKLRFYFLPLSSRIMVVFVGVRLGLHSPPSSISGNPDLTCLSLSLSFFLSFFSFFFLSLRYIICI